MILEFKNYILLSLKEHNEVLSIRNSDHVRNNMKNKDIIDIQEHLNWIENLKKDTHNSYYAVLVNGIISGAVYITEIDYGKGVCTWGLYFKNNINPFISSFSAYLLIDRVFKILDMKRLNLEVNKLNINAYKFDLNFGFQVYDEYRDMSDEYYLMFMNQDSWDKHKNTGLLKTIGRKLNKIEYTFK